MIILLKNQSETISCLVSYIPINIIANIEENLKCFMI